MKDASYRPAREGGAPAEPERQDHRRHRAAIPYKSVPREGEAPAEPTRQGIRRHNRSHPAHGLLVQSSTPTLVLLTVCTKDRTPWLVTPGIPNLIIDVWRQATAWLVGRYVIMPDHIHLFATPGDGILTLDAWVRYWKSQSSKRIPNSRYRWQTDHWDRRLRSGDSYASKWEYVRNNPVRHGLVAQPDEWPHQGELNTIPW